MQIVADSIEYYCSKHSSGNSKICSEIEAYTREHQPMSRMMVGSWEASMLRLLVQSIRAKNILEIGTFTGYSALAMAEGLPAGEGHVYTIDINHKTAERALSFWQKCNTSGNKITSIVKPALQALQELQAEGLVFDLVFIDADKKNTANYFEMSLSMLAPKGLVVVDNALQGGKVLAPIADSDATHMAAFNTMIRQRDDLQKVLLPIRDGVFLICRQ